MRTTWSPPLGSLTRGVLLAAASTALLFLSTGVLQGQEPTQITGAVTDEAGNPLVSASVAIVEMPYGASTNQQGRFLLTVPASAVQGQEVTLRAEMIGRTSQSETITLQPGGTVTVDFSLGQDPLRLDEVVATATGQGQQRRQIGSSVPVVDVSQINLTPVRSFDQLLQARSSGVSVVQSSGTSGSGARIRIRGSNSVSLDNAPLLIIDGVRVNNQAESYELFTGGQQSSRWNDINPEEIQSIEVLKGPSAASLYGTAAANGVVQITTRSGREGPAAWRFWAEGGFEDENVDFPDNVLAVDEAGDACNIFDVAGTGCTQAEVLRENPLENEEVSPFRTGWSQSYGISVSGGTEATSYFLSGEWADDTGTQLENRSDRANLRANVTGQLRDNLSISARVGYSDVDIQFPQNDNSALGVLYNALIGTPGASFDGYALPLDMLLAWNNFQDVTRSTLSGNLDWQPLDWLRVNATAGVDDTGREDRSDVPPGVLPFGPPFSVGFVEVVKTDVLNWTATSDVTADWQANENLGTSTSIGIQYFRERSNLIYATGTHRAPDTESLAAVTAGFDIDEENFENITLGAYLAETLSWRDRAFLNLAVRGDQNSAFGESLDWVWYPSVSASWLVSEEEFFPTDGVLDQLRLRAAWGQSGLRPQFRDAKRYFDVVTGARDDELAPGFVYGGVGNVQLEPEIATEFEIGAEVGLFEGRMSADLTYYNKKSEDAIVERTLAPSLGAVDVRFENIGEMTNTGWEFELGGDVLQRQDLVWTVDAFGSTNDNEVSSLGGEPPVVFGLLGSTQEHREGYAAGSYFQRPIESFEDADGDGVIGSDEVTVGSDRVAVGNPFPDLELSFSTDLRIMNRVTLSGLIDFKGGHQQFNATTWVRCIGSGTSCEAIQDADAPLADQAAVVAYATNETAAGFIEDADFWKLRELSVAFDAPQAWAQAFGGQSLRFTVAGRNLATWTDYSGFDPEVNGAGQANYATNDNTTLPPFRNFFVRMDVSF